MFLRASNKNLHYIVQRAAFIDQSNIENCWNTHLFMSRVLELLNVLLPEMTILIVTYVQKKAVKNIFYEKNLFGQSL